MFKCSEEMIEEFLNGFKREEVNHPKHYQSRSGLEAIDIIEDFDLNFNLGNVVKYVLRAGKKSDRIKDLQKAIWYLNRELNQQE